MFQWMRDLTAAERRTMAGCFGGWSLDALDVQIYSFVIPTLLATWHISRGEAGLLGTVTLVVSAFGGWFAGALYDHFGFYAPAFAAGALFNLANLLVIGFLVARQARQSRAPAVSHA